MGVTVKVNIDSNTILSNRHLEDGGAAQRLFCNEVWRLADPYTPMDSGILKSNVSMDLSGKQLTYNSPYARYQYYGQAMSGNPRQPNGNTLNYAGSPMRGAKWVERMWVDRKEDITNAVASFVGGHV